MQAAMRAKVWGYFKARFTLEERDSKVLLNKLADPLSLKFLEL